MTVPTTPLNNAGRTIKTALPTGKLIAQVGWTCFFDFFTALSKSTGTKIVKVFSCYGKSLW